MSLRPPKSRVAVFLAILVLAMACANWLAVRMGPTAPASALILMSTPAIAALLASLLTRRPLAEIGWRLKPIKWLALGWVLPIAYAMVTYTFIWVSDLGAVPNPLFLKRARMTLGLPETSPFLLITAAFFYITVINLIPSLLLSLGEEIGWRGFLVPELAKWVGWRYSACITGVLWSAWHLPGITSGEYGTSEIPTSFRLGCFFLMVFASSIIMAWLRMKSGSIIPVAIMHATHNGIIQVFLDRITLNTGNTAYFTGEFGIVLPVVLLVVAWIAWRGMADGQGGVIRSPS